MLAMMCGGVKAQEVALDTTSVDAKLLTAEGNKMPKYKSGVASLMQYLGNNLKYPKEALDNGVEGRVYPFLSHDLQILKSVDKNYRDFPTIV